MCCSKFGYCGVGLQYCGANSAVTAGPIAGKLRIIISNLILRCVLSAEVLLRKERNVDGSSEDVDNQADSSKHLNTNRTCLADVRSERCGENEIKINNQCYAMIRSGDKGCVIDEQCMGYQYGAVCDIRDGECIW